MFAIIMALFLFTPVSSSYATYTPETFPNSFTSPNLCNMRGLTMICDPNAVLASDNGGNLTYNHGLLENLAEKLRKTTKCACSPMDSNLGMCSGEGGFSLSVGLVEAMQLDGEEHSRVSVLEAAKKFADIVRNRQDRGQCDDDIFIFFSKKDHVMWTSVGEVTERYLTDELVNSITMNAEHYFRDGKYTEGLNYTITLYNQVLRNEEVNNTEWKIVTDVDLSPPQGYYWPVPLWVVISVGVILLLLSFGCIILSVWACCLCCPCCKGCCKGGRRQSYEMVSRR